MSRVDNEIEAFKRRLLEELRDEIPGRGEPLFSRIFPTGVPEKALVDALRLCERTIKKAAGTKMEILSSNEPTSRADLYEDGRI